MSDVLWQRCAGAEASRFGEEFVLLDPTGRTLRGLNPVAAHIWECLATAQPVAAIAQALVRHYPLSLERLTADAEAFLLACERAGLVERRLGDGGVVR